METKKPTKKELPQDRQLVGREGLNFLIKETNKYF